MAWYLLLAALFHKVELYILPPEIPGVHHSLCKWDVFLRDWSTILYMWTAAIQAKNLISCSSLQIEYTLSMCHGYLMTLLQLHYVAQNGYEDDHKLWVGKDLESFIRALVSSVKENNEKCMSGYPVV